MGMRPGGGKLQRDNDSPTCRASRFPLPAFPSVSGQPERAETMDPRPQPLPPLRALLTEAAEHRRYGDLAAAHAVELAALVALRAIVAETREVRHG